MSTTPARALAEFLNELLKADEDALNGLIDHRVPCSDALVEHPTVQVAVPPHHFAPSVPTVGLVGILNGFVGRIQPGAVLVAHYDGGRLVRFDTAENAASL